MFNADFGLPIVAGGGFNTTPSSLPYEIIANGRKPLDPGPPGKPEAPLVARDGCSRTAVKVRWKEAPLDLMAGDAPVDAYEVQWRAGSSRDLGWHGHARVTAGDATVYDTVAKEGGGTRTVKDDYLQFIVTGLSSGIAHEFRYVWPCRCC